MPLADDFQEILDALPSDWTDLELDLRVQEDRYVDAATLLVTCNAQPYSQPRLALPPRSSPTSSATPRRPRSSRGTLQLLDDAGIAGELVLREVREGRVEVTQMWGRPESVRQEFRKLRSSDRRTSPPPHPDHPT